MSERCRGFTLIEVLVALAIVAFGMAAVLAAMTSAADNAYYMRDKTLAQWVALNQIAEQRLKEAMPRKGKTEGEVEDFADRRWVWKQEVQPLQMKGMFRIDVSVRPLQPGEDKNSAISNPKGWYATASGVMGDAVDRSWNNTQYYEMSKGFGGPGSEGEPGDKQTGTPTNPNPNPNPQQAEQ